MQVKRNPKTNRGRESVGRAYARVSSRGKTDRNDPLGAVWYHYHGLRSSLIDSEQHSQFGLTFLFTILFISLVPRNFAVEHLLEAPEEFKTLRLQTQQGQNPHQ